MIPPIMWLLVVGVGAGLLGTGALMPEIGWFNLQGVSVNDATFMAPLSHANVDIDISKVEAASNGKSFYKNLITKCSFHTPDPGGLGPGSTVICKLTDMSGAVVAEGRGDFVNGLAKSERTLIDITMVASELANSIENIHDIKVVVLGGDPTAHICNQLMSDICIDFDGTTSSGRGLGSQESFLGATLLPLTGTATLDGVDWFDSDADGIHDLGWDALVIDESTGNCGTNAANLDNDQYDNNANDVDCVIVDISSMLQDTDAASADLEDGTDLSVNVNGFPSFWFHDDNGNLMYDDGEDIFLSADNIVD